MTSFVKARLFGVPVVISLLLLTGIAIEGQVDTASQLPSGNWTFSAHPYVGPGYDSRPVVVISVSTELKKGLTVAEVGLKNTSSKPVAGVKLSWSLSTEQNPTSMLLNGETPLVAISGGIPAGKRRLLTFPVTSFAKIHQPLLQGTTLSGDFRMELAVSEILYEDGSTAAIKNINNETYAKRGPLINARNTTNLTSVKLVSVTRVARQAGCPRQKCKYISDGGSHFQCEPAGTEPIYCNNRQSSCCNVLCGERPPGPAEFLD